MRKTFLEAVAQDIISKYGTNLSKIAIVFPNKRAALFMNEYLATAAQCPLWSPAYITISELFREKSSLLVADPIKQVCDLYRTFIGITGKDETLDHFYGCGQLLLADFDDIDKNMANAHDVFSNLKDIHELDSIDYLTQEQKNTLKTFFSNFTDDHLSRLKERFLALWCHLEDIYIQFNKHLAEQGLAYEGALYRSVVENKQNVYEYDQYLFVGFNVLQQVEIQLFLHLKEQDKARFYWDFDHYYLDNNEAGYYINQYLRVLGNELPIDSPAIYANMNEPKDITYISSMTESAQAHYITQWLQEEGRIDAGPRTAIVLCDEALLQMVLHCLPPEVKDVNITTGFPLTQSPVASFVQSLFRLQTLGHIKDTNKYRLHEVAKILTHPYARFISDKCIDLYHDLQEHKHFFPTRQELSLDEGLKLVFEDLSQQGESLNLNIAQWLLALLKHVGHQSHTENDPFTQESIFRMYTIINRLSGLISNGDLEVDKITFERLIGELIQSTSVPFKGEPVQGIQIMGVLETRNLDFKHLLVLSASENNMPKGVNDASIIPYSIRKAYGLTTIDHKVAIYAYYFYRLLQRASDITLTYNKATEDGQTGEMSRFMLQLLVEGPHPIVQKALIPDQNFKPCYAMNIEKTPEVMEKINQISKLSPTAINRYIYCPLTFFYNVIENLKEPDEEDGAMKDNRIFGLIFHRSAQLIYQRLTQKSDTIQKADIEDLLAHQPVIEMIVDQAFREELFKVNDNSYTPEYNGLQLINRGVVISFLHKLLNIDLELTPFNILGLEKEVETAFDFECVSGKKTLTIHGFIDRLDSITDADGCKRIRVIDYKTGKPATSRATAISELFERMGPALERKHTNYYLQALLYSIIVSHDKSLNANQLPVSPSLIFVQNTSNKHYDPTLVLDKEKMLRATDYEKEFNQGLTDLLREIFNPDIPFIPTTNKARCASCVYRNLCKK